MSELFFVVKCLVLTAALTLLSQVRLGNSTIEQRANQWLVASPAAVWVQSAAAGGALAITHLARSVREGVNGGADSFERGAREQRAGR